MKITCLVRSISMGGLERQMMGLAIMLSKAGHDVELVKYVQDEYFRHELEINGIPIVSIPHKGGTLGIAFKLAEHLRKNDTRLLIAFGNSANAKACIARIISNSFSLIVSERNYIKRFHISDWYRFLLYLWKADFVIGNSHAQSEHMKKAFPLLAPKTSTIVNFTDLEQFCYKERNYSTESPLSIAVMSRISRRKNMHGLIKAAAILKDKGLDFRIRWYGERSESAYLKSCRKLIAESGLEEVFSILPSEHEVKEIYYNNDILCLPSFYEGTPNCVCEAMACGMPVACSAVSDNALYVQPGRNGWLFDPTDINSMATCLESIILDKKKALKAYGLESSSIAMEKFSSERFLSEYLHLLESLPETEL